MRRWFSDGVFRAIVRNASYLGSSKVLSMPLGLIALACTGRGLTPLLFGILTIIHTYATTTGALAKFQTWQFIVRYATPAMQRGDKNHASDVIRFAFGLDIVSGLAGMVVAIALLPLLASHFGLDKQYLTLAMIYCTLVPTMTAATATGVLRVFDRFDLMSMQQMTTPILRAIGCVISYFGHLGFIGFVVTWYVADLANDVVIWSLAARELHRHDMLQAFRPGLLKTARRLPKAWSFVWTTNFSHSLYSAWGPLSNLVVAAVLGPVATGLYKISSTLLNSASKPADLLSRGFYPEIMRLDPASRQPWVLGLRIGLLAGLLGSVVLLLVLVGGQPLIGLIFGKKYLAAFGVFRIMTWSLMISMASFPLESLLYMAGRQGTMLWVRGAATVLYLGLLAGLSHVFGLTGAGYAYLLGTSAMALLMLAPVISCYKHRSRLVAHFPSAQANP